MDEEEISENELTDLIRRFELDLSNNRFEYFAQYLWSALMDHYIEHANYSKAADAIHVALEQHPYHASFFAKKAFIHTINEESDEALGEIDKALEFEPGNPEFLTQKGSIIELMGKPLMALDLFDQAIENGAFLQDVLVLKMFVYFNVGNQALALSMIEQLFSKEIEEDRIIMEAHFCLQLMEAYEEGVRIFRAYTDIDPFQEVVWYHLGQLYACNEQFEQAIDAFDFAIAIDDVYAEPVLEKGYCLMQLNLFEKATACFEDFIQLEGPDPLALTQLGDCFKYLHRYQKARHFYRQALKYDQKFTPAWLGLGQTYSIEERHGEALPFFQKAAKISPGDETIQVEVARTMAHLKRFDAANIILNEIIDNYPSCAAAWLIKATILHEKDRTKEAAELLELSLSNIKNNSKILYKLAAYCLNLGRARQGYEYLTDALMLNFEEHYLLFDDAPFLIEVQAVNDIIDLYRNED